jgi:hypothetical protein
MNKKDDKTLFNREFLQLFPPDWGGIVECGDKKSTAERRPMRRIQYPEKSKRQIEDEKNKYLLEQFDTYRWPKKKLARHLARLNMLYSTRIYGTRGAYKNETINRQTETIFRQLRRLLKKRGDPPGRRGRPASNKEGPDRFMQALERFRKAEAKPHK